MKKVGEHIVTNKLLLTKLSFQAKLPTDFPSETTN